MSITEISLEPKEDSLPIAEFKSFKYKKVANRTKPVSTDLPSKFQIIHKIPEGVNPLADMPTLPTRPGEFIPGKRYTLERMAVMNISPDGFLWEDEVRIVHELI